VNYCRRRHIVDESLDLMSFRQIDGTHIYFSGHRGIHVSVRRDDHLKLVCQKALHHRPADPARRRR
jgi:hypothetical protein